MPTTTRKPPSFDTIPEALDHLTGKGSAGAQAAYLELLAITGRRGECEDCAVANFIYITTGIRVSVDPTAPGKVTVLFPGEGKFDLSPSTRTLASRFDGHHYPNLTAPCVCGAPHEHPTYSCCDENTCVGHLPDCPDRPAGEGEADEDEEG